MATNLASSDTTRLTGLLQGDITRVVLIGLAVGILGGMGTFIYSRPLVSPFGDSIVGLVILGLAGGFTHLLARSMWESVRAMVVGFVIGVATTVLAWVAPLWIVGIHPRARDLIIMGYLQQAFATIVMAYLLVYFAGYFVVVTLDGLLA